MIDVGRMIASIRKERGLSQQQLANKLKISKQAVSNYERGTREPDYVTLEAIADVLNVPMSMLISPKDQAKALKSIYATYPQSPNAVHIPVLGTIPAGIPLEAIEDIIDFEEVPSEWIRGGKEYFALQIHGNSMYPRYEDGDVIILRKQDDCESGQDCVVTVNGDDATFKRVRKTASGIILHPINPDYESYVFTNEQIEELPVRIQGVVVELRRKMN